MFPVQLTRSMQSCGLFGAVRRYDIHTGVDFYCEDGADVSCLRAGVVIDVFQFTGEAVGSPWWNTTYAVVVESGHMIFVYDEVLPGVTVGQSVAVGDIIGHVTPVLKRDKGVTPTSMLHLEIWMKRFYKKNYTWPLGEPKPEGLFDPLQILTFWLIKTEHGYLLEDVRGNIIQWFDMACNCKAFCMEYRIEPIYLTQKSRLADRQAYEVYTGKTLWWNRNEIGG